MHRLDLDNEQVEGICMQVKADSRDVLVGTIYWPPNRNSEFFTAFPKLVENIWIKFSNIILLGDFNTNLLQDGHGDTSYEGNKMKGIFEQFNMNKVVKGPTRVTIYSKMLIDIIVTNRKDLVKQKGTCPLGISDHDMIYATLSASILRSTLFYSVQFELAVDMNRRIHASVSSVFLRVFSSFEQISYQDRFFLFQQIVL